MALEPHLTSMADDGKLHIVMVSWLVLGHMILYLELTKLIAQKGHKVSFVSTPRNIDRLPKLPPSLYYLLNFAKIPLPSTENLPENTDATSDLPYDKV
ncbi:UDP-glycosyltransferase 91A1 [Camellia lanceoleosa]|nr:UDP-glycosyltransferase 91A1 [Camellia lanceoleosa]